MFAGRTYMYVAWFSVSNFVTACLLPYVMPFDQGVMQRSFDAGLYVMRLMHGSSTAVMCHVRVAAAGDGAAAGVGASVVGPRPRAQQKQAINTKGKCAGHITAIATAGCWVQCVFDAFRMSWPSQGA